MTKAMPVLDVGDAGSSDMRMSRFLLKQFLTWSVISWFMWVSWSANIAILCSYRVLFISLHLLRRGMSREVAPFMFSVTMFKFAFFGCFFLCDDGVLFSSGVEGQGYSRGIALCD